MTGDGESRDRGERETPLFETDEARFVEQRAAYLERTAGLPKKQGRVLALSELGYSTSGIAKHVEHTASTADGYLDRIEVQFGPAAAFAKRTDELGVGVDLTPVTRDELLEYHADTIARWRALAAAHPDVAPDWFDADDETDTGNETADGGRRVETAVVGGER